MMTDKTIHTSIVLQVCLCMSQRTETETEYTEDNREEESSHRPQIVENKNGIPRTKQIFCKMWRFCSKRFFSRFPYVPVVDCGVVFEDGSDKQQNSDERNTNF